MEVLVKTKAALVTTKATAEVIIVRATVAYYAIARQYQIETFYLLTQLLAAS